MNSQALKDKLVKAQERVERTLKTIERHKTQLEKKQKRLLRVEWMAEYLDNMEAVMWDEERRAEYKKATGDDLYWDCCEVSYKEEDIKNSFKKLEEQRQIVKNWEEKYNRRVAIENQMAFEMPEIFAQLKEALTKEWTDWDIKHRESLKERYKELGWDEFIKLYKYNGYEEMRKTDDQYQKSNERDAELYIVDLYNRVKEITGEVTDWRGIYFSGKALNGTVIGKSGTAVVETIGAGGYNIQRYHLRVLVHKMK